MKKLFLSFILLGFISAPAGISAGPSDPRAALRDRFERDFRKTTESLDAVFGVVVQDLKTGETFAVNENLVVAQASVIKVPILVELYKQVDAGKIDLHETVTVNSDSMVGGSGILRRLTAGKVSMTIRDLAVMMIVLSDNTATNFLIDLVGMENVTDTMAELGFPETRLRRVMMDLQARNENRENVSTPREAARLLEALHNAEILNAEHCADILDILAIPKSGRISRDLPPGTRVANKTGSIPGVVNDIGIVYAGERSFIVSAMASWNADRDAAENAIAEVSRLAFEYFSRLENSSEFGYRR